MKDGAMRLFDGDIKIEPLVAGGLRIILETSVGERVAAEISGEHVNTFRRAVFLPKGDHLDMSAIKEVKELIRDDLKRVNDAARAARDKGMLVRDKANEAVTKIDSHFDDELKEIAELESELAGMSNFPPEGVA